MDYQRNQRSGNDSSQNRSQMNNTSSAPPSRNNMNQGGSGGPMLGNPNVQAEILFLKQEAAFSRNAIFALEQEKDSLRKAIRKLKVKIGIFMYSIVFLARKLPTSSKIQTYTRECK